MRRTLERALIAYFVGAMLGLMAQAAEKLLGSGASGPAAYAVYSLVGGFAAAVARTSAEMIWPGHGARAASFGVLAGLGTLYLAYFANVRLLPGEPYWTPKSLGLDFLILAALMGCAYGLLQSRRAHELRLRLGLVACAGGAFALAIGLAAIAAAWPSAVHAQPIRVGDGPNLLLVVLDSVRRDRLGFPSRSLSTSTELDRWAARSRVFSRAYAASSWTVPSVREMLATESSPRLARRLAGRGYVIGCFTDNPHLAPGSALVAGCDVVERSVGRWRELLHGTVLGETIERVDSGSDERLVTKAAAWASQQGSPVFLYLHLMDSHTPYRHPPIDGKRRGGRQIEFPREGMAMTAEEAEDVVARYDGGVRSADRAAGWILAAAEAWDRSWLAIVTSDHGESLGEEGRWFHGTSLHQELLDIPLLVTGTDIEPGVFDGVVGHDAIPVTFAAAAGSPCDDCELPDLRTSSGGRETQGSLPPKLLYRIVDDMKVTFDPQAREAKLFDIRRDPRELRDLARTSGGVAARLAAPLVEQSHPGPEPGGEGDVERLKALGYVAGGAGVNNSH